VPSRRLETELIVKGDHAINIYLRNIKKLGNLKHSLPGKIAKLALNLLQDGDKIPPVSTKPL
jgi:hypothetical protein